MFFTYEGINLEHYWTRITKRSMITKKVGLPVFYFKNEEMHMVLNYSDKRGWTVNFGCTITQEELKQNQLFKFINKGASERAIEGEKLLRYLFLKSPMRLRFLNEYGPLEKLL